MENISILFLERFKLFCLWKIKIWSTTSNEGLKFRKIFLIFLLFSPAPRVESRAAHACKLAKLAPLGNISVKNCRLSKVKCIRHEWDHRKEHETLCRIIIKISNTWKITVIKSLKFCLNNCLHEIWHSIVLYPHYLTKFRISNLLYLWNTWKEIF